MSNVKDFKLAYAVKFHSDDVIGRLSQIESIASNSPERAGCQAIASVCKTTRNSVSKDWQAMLVVGVGLSPHLHFAMASSIQMSEQTPVFLSIEAFPPAAVEPAIFGNNKERLIAWHSSWVKAHADLIWSFGFSVGAVIAYVTLHERCVIEEQSKNRVVFLSRGYGAKGWARITIDLSVAEQDAAYMEAAIKRLENPDAETN